MILQVATALAIGAYAVLSKEAQHGRPDAIPREAFMAILSRTAMITDRVSLLKARWADKVIRGAAMLLIAITTISS